MAVWLDKTTPGLLALLGAVRKDGPGVKFITVRQALACASLGDRAEVLYGGDDVGFVGGTPTRDSIMGLAALIDAAVHRGHGHLVVVTEHPTQPGGRGDVPHLTVTRYILTSEWGVRHVSDWTRLTWGHCPDVFELAERDRLARDKACIDDVAAILKRRREVRARVQ